MTILNDCILLRDNFFHVTCINLIILHLVNQREKYTELQISLTNYFGPIALHSIIGPKLTITSPKQKPKICPYLNG